MPERPEVIKMRENAHDRQYVLENVSKEGARPDCEACCRGLSSPEGGDLFASL